MYKRPDNVKADMGGTDEILDDRLSDVIEMLKQAPIDSLRTFLDVGIGKGQLAKWLAAQGKIVIGTGLEIDSYEVDIAKLNDDYGIQVVECNAEQMPFGDETFDAVVMSHILEHCPNVGAVLREVHRVLSDEGWLFLFVPPHSDYVCAGHISVGWNIGQLMYVLLLNGFDVKNGKFIELGYNVCAFVRKSSIPLPPLRGDRGDIYILAENNLFPLPVISDDGNNDGFTGKITAVNWDNASELLLSKSPEVGRAKKAVLFICRFIPKVIRNRIGQLMLRLGGLLVDNNKGKTINPKSLTG